MPSAASIFARPRNGLQTLAYDRLKSLIVSGELPSGSFVSQRGLASQLGMSKTPVLVALERLQADGFVEISPQQGVMVREMSIEDIADHYDFREALESHAVRRLAGRLSIEQVGTLRENLRRQKETMESGDLACFIQLDATFHLTLAGFLGNRQIISTMEQMRDRIHQIILRMSSLDPARLEKGISEHAAIVDALEAGDGERAAAQMRTHLEAGRRRLLNPARP